VELSAWTFLSTKNLYSIVLTLMRFAVLLQVAACGGDA
jgi:hypothetical protein